MTLDKSPAPVPAPPCAAPPGDGDAEAALPRPWATMHTPISGTGHAATRPRPNAGARAGVA